MTRDIPKNIHPVIIKLLTNRGLSRQDFDDFFSWDLRSLPDLTALKDLQKAAVRIVEAIGQNESIAVFGDYDVDGTTSCALLFHFFKSIGKSILTYQPNRFTEGYGIHPSSIDQAINDKIKVIITVDCGISNHETAEYARQKNIDLIITDHHEDNSSNPMPSAFAIINPNRRDEPPNSPLRCLAGVGVAFTLALAIKNELEKTNPSIASLYPLLQFVALGTLCDLAPLQLPNLRLVRHGLKQMPSSQYPGILQFIDKNMRKQTMIPSEHVSFQIGPKINSKGRLDHPEKALVLLTTSDSQTAWEHYNHVDHCNNERKIIQARIYEEAREIILQNLQGKDHLASIVYKEDWHEGVIGIVANKLVEEFKVPAIVFTNSSEPHIIKASARTAGTLNLFETLKELSHLYLKFGGHHSAAGLSMSKDNLKTFTNLLHEKLGKIPAIERTETMTFDLEIQPQDITPTLLKDLELLEPFGNSNEKPIFRMSGMQLESYDILQNKHVRWSIKHNNGNGPSLKGISFNYINSWESAHPGDLYAQQKTTDETLTVYFNLGINRWNGNEYPQLFIRKINFGIF